MLLANIFVFFVLFYKTKSQQSCLEVPKNPGDPLGIEYIGTQSTSDNGTCAVWTTAAGNVNYLLSSQFPDISIQNAQNYCRNPSSPIGIYEPRPWCWLQADTKSFGYCTIPSCAGICRTTSFGEIFQGTGSKTISGLTCQNWSSQSPHAHSYNSGNWPIPGETIVQAGNNCRNPNNSSFGLWCYTTSAIPVWEPCMAPVCKSTTGCVNGVTNYLFKSQTATEQYLQSCVPWANIPLQYSNQSATPTILTTSDIVNPIFHPALLPDASLSDASNYCRNPDNDAVGGWCYVTNGTHFLKKYCKTPCSGIWACLFDRTGSYYQGIVSVTEKNETCASWSSKGSIYTNANFPENSIANANNYCRNPTNNTGGPWCWLQSDLNKFGFCTIPTCQQTPPLPPLTTTAGNATCQSTTSGVEYAGTIAITTNSNPCAPWTTTTTFYNPYFNRPILFKTATMAEVANYCRNPNADPSGPWCYTTTGNQEYCTIPKCFTTTPATITRNNCRTSVAGTEYTGTISTTAKGDTCTLWSSVTNGNFNDSSFPDGSAANAVNYCRNLPGSTLPGPFCFVGPNRVMCVVPMCNTATCRTTVEGYSYAGTQAISKSGLPCLPWTNISVTSIEPNYFPDQSIVAAKNYCRSPSNVLSVDGPFCYTSLTTTETCNISYCTPQCRNSQTATDYAGIVNRTNSGVCMFWTDPRNINFRNPQLLNAAKLEDAANYCRNPDSDPLGPWCYLESQVKIYCQLPVCSPTQGCYTQNNAWAYTGNINVTKNGVSCLKWSDYPPALFDASISPTFMSQLLPDASTADAQNYCRTPTNQSAYSGSPWCYYSEPQVNGSTLSFFGYCNVTICTSCYTFENVSRYNGFANTTSNGTPCLVWSTMNMTSLSKLSGPNYVSSLLPDNTVVAANNYCRVPTRDIGYINQPWCYVSPSSVLSQTTGQNFGFCTINTCPTAAIINPINTFQTFFMTILMAGFVTVATLSLTSTTMAIFEMNMNIFSESKEIILSNESRPLPPEPFYEAIEPQTASSQVYNSAPVQYQNPNIANSGQEFSESTQMVNAPKVIGTVSEGMSYVTVSDNQNQSSQQMTSKYRPVQLGYDNYSNIMISGNEIIVPMNANTVYGAPKIIGTETSNEYSLAVSSNMDNDQNTTIPGVVKVNSSSIGGSLNAGNVMMMSSQSGQSGGYGGQSGGYGGQAAGFGGQAAGFGGQAAGFGGQAAGFGGQSGGYGGQSGGLGGQAVGYGGQSGGYGGQSGGFGGQSGGFGGQSGGFGGQSGGFGKQSGGFGGQSGGLGGQAVRYGGQSGGGSGASVEYVIKPNVTSGLQQSVGQEYGSNESTTGTKNAVYYDINNPSVKYEVFNMSDIGGSSSGGNMQKRVIVSNQDHSTAQFKETSLSGNQNNQAGNASRAEKTETQQGTNQSSQNKLGQ